MQNIKKNYKEEREEKGKKRTKEWSQMEEEGVTRRKRKKNE